MFNGSTPYLCHAVPQCCAGLVAAVLRQGEFITSFEEVCSGSTVFATHAALTCSLTPLSAARRSSSSPLCEPKRPQTNERREVVSASACSMTRR